MLIDIPSVTEEGIQDKQELKERCDWIKILNEGLDRKANYLYREKITGIHFTLPVIKGFGDLTGGVDDRFDFPYSPEFIQERVVQRKEREVKTTEVYYE